MFRDRSFESFTGINDAESGGTVVVSYLRQEIVRSFNRISQMAPTV